MRVQESYGGVERRTIPYPSLTVATSTKYINTCSAALFDTGATVPFLRDEIAGIDIEGCGQLAQPLQSWALPSRHDFPEMASADSSEIGKMRYGDPAPLCLLPDVPDHPAMKLVRACHVARTVGSVRRSGVRYSGVRY
jgi:hypothetical protein